MKQHLNSLIIALTAIIVCAIATQAYKNRNNKTETINVTGLQKGLQKRSDRLECEL